ncbi:MAG: hypothetical protein Q7S10_01940, partial [bacterium]|nr:hypothetical protein [bacterium]
TVADTTDTTSFIAMFESATGDLAPKTDGGLTYNANTGVLTATGFAGPLTGNVTGNVSGTAATVTGAAQSAITSVGALTSLTIDAAGVTIDTDGDGAITFLGVGDGTNDFDEDLTLNLVDTTNTGTFSSSTALATLAFGGIALTTDTLTLTGTGTLNGLDALDATSETTIEAALDTLANVTSIQGQTVTISGTTDISGTNTGDQTTVSGNAGTVTFADAGGDTTTSVALGTAATGSLAPATDAGLTYNATTDALTAATFIGALTGNVTGNVSGTAATVTGAAQTAITSVGTLTGLTVSGLTTASANLNISNGATGSGILKILEDTDAGSNFATFQVPALAGDTVYILPADDGEAGEQLQTDGGGILTWESAGGTPTVITVADTTDTTSFVALFTDATGDLAPKTDAGITYNAGTGTLAVTALTMGGTLSMGANDITGTTGLINYSNFDVSAAGGITVAAAEGLDTNGAGALELGKANATSIDLCNSANCDTINIGNLATTDADTIVIGDALDDVAISDAQWSITGGGALTVTSCVGCSSGGDFIAKAKSADQSVTNSTTLVDETALQFTIPADEEWNVVWTLQVTNGNSGGPDWKSAVVNAGSTCTATQSGMGPSEKVILQRTTTDCIEAPGTLADTNVNGDAGVPFEVIIYANILGDATPDAVKMQFAHNTATVAVALTVKAGSIMTAYKVTGADLAESYYTTDPALMAGDVVAIDDSIVAGVKKTSLAYDSKTLGVISSKPGLVIGDSSNVVDRPVFVALAGRVPVKVSAENGAIKPGDYLTASSRPGVAMKATKAGAVIGQAITGFEGQGVGAVTVFIKNGQGNGAKLADSLPAQAGLPVLNEDGSVSLSTTRGELALAQLISQKENLATALNLSEITTDRMMAGLEIITPSLISDTVKTNIISPGTAAGITMDLGDNGAFIIQGAQPAAAAEGEASVPAAPVITFDSLGNAFFAGDLEAKNIKANSIAGLSVFTDKISSLSANVQALSDTSGQWAEEEMVGDVRSGVEALAVSLKEMGLRLDMIDIRLIVAETLLPGMQAAITGLAEKDTALQTAQEAQAQAMESLAERMTSLEEAAPLDISSMDLAGSLTVQGGAVVKGGLQIDSLGANGNEIAFMSDTLFFGRPYFTTDTAGFAIIAQGERKIDITFEREYIEQPVVNATISIDRQENASAQQALEEAVLGTDTRFVVTNKHAKGFTILLNRPAPTSIPFSWIALAVRGAKTFTLIPSSQAEPSLPPTLEPALEPVFPETTAEPATDPVSPEADSVLPAADEEPAVENATSPEPAPASESEPEVIVPSEPVSEPPAEVPPAPEPQPVESSEPAPEASSTATE